MGALLDGSGAFMRRATSGITAFPWTVMAWVRPHSVTADGTICSLSSGSSDDNPVFRRNATYGIYNGTSAVFTPSIAAVGRWDFVVGRFISSSLSRLHVLTGTGTIASVQLTTVATAFFNQQVIGATYVGSATNFFNGVIAEVTFLKGDVQSDTGVIAAPLLHQLAYGGPFSVGNLGDKVVNHDSFRSYTGGDTTNIEAYETGLSSALINAGGVPGPHPPLPSTYARPSESRRILVI